MPRFITYDIIIISLCRRSFILDVIAHVIRARKRIYCACVSDSGIYACACMNIALCLPIMEVAVRVLLAALLGLYWSSSRVEGTHLIKYS